MIESDQITMSRYERVQKAVELCGNTAPLTYYLRRGLIDPEDVEEYAANSPFKDSAAVDDILPFQKLRQNGTPYAPNDAAIFNYICFAVKLFFLGGIPYIYDKGVYKADEGGTKLKSLVRRLIHPDVLTSTAVNRIYGLFLQADELQRTSEEINLYPAHWVNFRNGFYDPIENQIIPHDPKYYAVNQIPHSFDPEAKPDCDIILRWFESAFTSLEDLEMFLQYVGLMMTRDTRQQKMLIICGLESSGKSTALRLTESIIGSANCSHVSLSELTQRFASYGLVGKSANICADLEIGALDDVSLVKKLVGEDTLRVEKKGLDSFSYRPYTRLMFSTNELPIIKGERSGGFYRRLLILRMDNKPTEIIPNFLEKLQSQSDYFIHACMDALGRLYHNGVIYESKSSAQLVGQLRCDSDTTQSFLDENPDVTSGSRIERGRIYSRYEKFCTENDRQALSKTALFRALRAKGFREIASGGVRYFYYECRK